MSEALDKVTRSIPAKDLVGVIGAHLQTFGFFLAHKSGTGSRYYRYPGSPFQLRISDHRWSGYNSTRQAQVVKSVILKPVPASQTYFLALEFALGFLVRASARSGSIRMMSEETDVGP